MLKKKQNYPLYQITPDSLHYKKKYSGHAEYFTFLIKKSTFFSGRTTPPLIGDMSPKKSSFIFTPSLSSVKEERVPAY